MAARPDFCTIFPRAFEIMNLPLSVGFYFCLGFGWALVRGPKFWF